jgi:hypothetical protein
VVEHVTTHRKPPEVRIWTLRNQSRVGTVPSCNPQKMLSRWLLFMLLLHGIMTGTPRQLSRERCLGRLINPVG